MTSRAVNTANSGLNAAQVGTRIHQGSHVKHNTSVDFSFCPDRSSANTLRLTRLNLLFERIADRKTLGVQAGIIYQLIVESDVSQNTIEKYSVKLGMNGLEQEEREQSSKSTKARKKAKTSKTRRSKVEKRNDWQDRIISRGPFLSMFKDESVTVVNSLISTAERRRMSKRVQVKGSRRMNIMLPTIGHSASSNHENIFRPVTDRHNHENLRGRVTNHDQPKEFLEQDISNGTLTSSKMISISHSKKKQAKGETTESDPQLDAENSGSRQLLLRSTNIKTFQPNFHDRHQASDNRGDDPLRPFRSYSEVLPWSQIQHQDQNKHQHSDWSKVINNLESSLFVESSSRMDGVVVGCARGIDFSRSQNIVSQARSPTCTDRRIFSQDDKLSGCTSYLLAKPRSHSTTYAVAKRRRTQPQSVTGREITGDDFECHCQLFEGLIAFLKDLFSWEPRHALAYDCDTSTFESYAWSTNSSDEIERTRTNIRY